MNQLKDILIINKVTGTASFVYEKSSDFFIAPNYNNCSYFGEVIRYCFIHNFNKIANNTIIIANDSTSSTDFMIGLFTLLICGYCLLTVAKILFKILMFVLVIFAFVKFFDKKK